MSVLERMAVVIADDPVNWLDYLPQARAVLVVMREPDQAGVLAAHQLLSRNQGPASQHDIRRAWQAQIDTALGDGQ